MDERRMPTVAGLLWPTLQAVIEIGGSGTLDEVNEQVAARESFSEEQQGVIHNKGPRTEIEYRLAWARTYLKGMSLLENSERGVWSATELSRSATKGDVERLLHDYRLALRDARRARAQTDGATDVEEDADEGDWRTELLEILLDLTPEQFEHLARRLLLEAGFVSARVTGRSGDGGIDGIGTYRLALVSFPVFFQCKRYRGSVRATAVRDFRGAMTGRGDRGLLITTGTFTSEARQEASRDGAPPIDLIDGERLCDLLKEHRLGVIANVRQVEDVSVDRDFFADV